MNLPSDITLTTLLRGAGMSLPQAASVVKGWWQLLRLKPDAAGSIGALLEDRARRWPDQCALRYLDQQWTYAQLNAWANQVAAVLAQRGIGPGDVVGILMDNRPECLVCVAATIKLGAIAGMLNHHQRDEVQAHSIESISPSLFIVDEVGAIALQSAGYGPGTPKDQSPCLEVMSTRQSPATPVGMISLAREVAGAATSNPDSTATVLLNQPCFYIFTSGTSGLPKASVMTHYRWMRAMAGVGHMTARLSRTDVLYLPLPLYHNNALTISWGAALSAGACLALSPRFSVSRFWDEAEQHGATAFCYIGEICRYLLERPASANDQAHGIQLALGNGLRADIWPRFQARFGIERIAEFYAASECNLVFVNAFNQEATAGFCPLTYAIVEVDHETATPHRTSSGQAIRVSKGGTGLLITEVDARKPFDGYKDRRASEQKLLRGLFTPDDCWFNTGDLVRDQGWRHMQFVDRLGDTYRWKGENVATTEVERAMDHFPQILESVVYGVALPHCDGRAGMAALRLRQEDGALRGQELAQHLFTHLPAYAVPLFLRLRQDQAITQTFKHRKGELKADGIDLARCSEPLFVLMERTQGYVPLTPELADQISRQSWRW
jgi:acyl-CoA synthetase (AMP-forming)/AMP-acid ligase II